MRWRSVAYAWAVAGVAFLVATGAATAAWRLDREMGSLAGRLALMSQAIRRTDPSPSPSFDPRQIVQRVKASVVTISAGDHLGSGFAFGRSGGQTLIVTNHHVIAGPHGRVQGAVTVQRGGDRWLGQVLSFDPEEDLALIGIPEELPLLASAHVMGHPPEVGDPVLVYGSPEGFEGTASVGIVSALRGDWIQTDAEINPGSSGGPVVNMHGEVLGVTSLAFGRGASGLGFAIDIRRVCVLHPALTCG